MFCPHALQLERPYSYSLPCGRFPKRVQLWTRWVDVGAVGAVLHGMRMWACATG